MAALVQDLKQRGLLDDTLVVWGGEFGRTVTARAIFDRRIMGATTIPAALRFGWRAAALRPGLSYGETDDYSYNITTNPVHVHDMNATLLHCLGIDHTKLTYRYQGRDFRLTDVHGTVVKDLLA